MLWSIHGPCTVLWRGVLDVCLTLSCQHCSTAGCCLIEKLSTRLLLQRNTDTSVNRHQLLKHSPAHPVHEGRVSLMATMNDQQQNLHLKASGSGASGFRYTLAGVAALIVTACLTLVSITASIQPLQTHTSTPLPPTTETAAVAAGCLATHLGQCAEQQLQPWTQHC